MKLSDTNLSYAERALLERIVEPGEDIRWHGSPDALSFFKECMPIVLFSCFFVAIPLFIIIMSLHESGLENCDPMLLAPAFFILFGLSFPTLFQAQPPSLVSVDQSASHSGSAQRFFRRQGSSLSHRRRYVARFEEKERWQR